MRKIGFLIVFALTIVVCQAQEYYKEVMEQLPQMTPREAVYSLSDYQASYPHYANVYYQLGKLQEQLIKGEHPIRDYKELSLYLYNISLYYGNCLHYSTEQFKTVYYDDVPKVGKKLTLPELENYLRPKMREAEERKKKLDKLYSAYYQLIERYEECQKLFTFFSDKYMREKNAHLLLDQEDRVLLGSLTQKADSLNSDIEAYTEALKAYPIEDYNPTFRYTDIDLYRLDGLTKTDFLANDVNLWNYSSWAATFSKTQDSVYNALFADCDKEHQNIMQLIDDTALTSYETDKVLPNRIERVDYRSFLSHFIRAEQLLANAVITRRDTIFKTAWHNDDMWETGLSLAYNIHQSAIELAEEKHQFEQLYNENEAKKYTQFLEHNFRETLMPDIDKVITGFEDIQSIVADSILRQAQQLNIDYSDYSRLALTDELKQEKLIVTPDNDMFTIKRQNSKKKTLSTLEIPMEGNVVGLVSVADKYLAFVTYTRLYNKEVQKPQLASILFSETCEALRINYYDIEAMGLLSYKLGSNTIAVLAKIAEQESRGVLIFVDKEGKIK